MRTQKWQLAYGLMLTGFLAGFQNAAAHSSDRDVCITVHVRNYAGVDAKTLKDAERIAAAIFSKAGVESRWIDESDEPSPPQNRDADSEDQTPTNLSHIGLHILSPDMAGRLTLPDNVMGLSPGTGPDRQFVYVFHKRAKELALRQVTAVAKEEISRPATLNQILGAIIAHEIGHILLNRSSHTETGIMRGTWDLTNLSDIAYESLFFTSRQAVVIRAEVVRRNAAR